VSISAECPLAEHYGRRRVVLKKDMPMPAPRWYEPPKPRPMPRASHRLPGRKVPRELEHWTGFSVIAVADGAQRRYFAALKKLHLTIPEFMVLAVVVKQDGIVACDIAERLGISPQRVSEILCEFDRNEYIVRDTKVYDFRYKGCWLSNRGRDVYAEAAAAISRADHALHLDMSEQRRIALRKLLLGLVPGSRVDAYVGRYGG
jgi:DNA-binding MarR family transcriptional regulator